MKPRDLIFFISVCGLLCLSGWNCSYQDIWKKIGSEETDQFAREYIKLVREGDIAKAEELLDPEIVGTQFQSRFKETQGYLNRSELISIEFIDYKLKSSSSKKDHYKLYDLVYQLHFEKAWILVEVIVKEKEHKKQIYGIHVKEIPKPIEELNAFHLSEKSIIHYLILAATLIVPTFIISSIILCARTKMKRKGLWITFMLFGFGKLIMNWGTGEVGYQLFSFNLLGAGFMRSGMYGPWILTVAFPLGAVLFLIKRKNITGLGSGLDI